MEFIRLFLFVFRNVIIVFNDASRVKAIGAKGCSTQTAQVKWHQKTEGSGPNAPAAHYASPLPCGLCMCEFASVCVWALRLCASEQT